MGALLVHMESLLLPLMSLLIRLDELDVELGSLKKQVKDLYPPRIVPTYTCTCTVMQDTTQSWVNKGQVTVVLESCSQSNVYQ